MSGYRIAGTLAIRLPLIVCLAFAGDFGVGRAKPNRLLLPRRRWDVDLVRTLNCRAWQTDWCGIGVAGTFDRLAEVAASRGPGGQNDPDNLMIGNGVRTPTRSGGR